VEVGFAFVKHIPWDFINEIQIQQPLRLSSVSVDHIVDDL
jgi:hypothetical protein